MNNSIEEKFVKKFIIKPKRERVLYELSSSKKRKQVIHQIIRFIDERHIILSDSKISDNDLLKRIDKVFDTNSECYVIADSPDDGKILPFKTAFDNMINDCADYFIICGESVVVLKEEVIFGGASRMILVNKG